MYVGWIWNLLKLMRYVAHVRLWIYQFSKFRIKQNTKPSPSQSKHFHHSHFKIPSEGCTARVTPGIPRRVPFSLFLWLLTSLLQKRRSVPKPYVSKHKLKPLNDDTVRCLTAWKFVWGWKKYYLWQTIVDER